MSPSAKTAFPIEGAASDIIDYVYDMLKALADLASRADDEELARAIRIAGMRSDLSGKSAN